MSKAWSVVVVVGALAVSVAGRAAEVHDLDLEGYLAPPARARIDASVPSPFAGSAPLPDDASRRVAAATRLPQALSLVWIDSAGAAAGSERAARDESVRLLRALGVEATWRTGRADETARPGEVRVIMLDRAAVDRAGSPVLGSTPARLEGEPCFWVHVPSVRGALGLDAQRPLGPDQLRDRHLLGVAVGRVIVHETVHAVAPGIPHGAGLMAPCLKKGDLTSKTLAVSAELGEAVRAALVAGSVALAEGQPSAVRLLTVGRDGPEVPR